MKVIKIEKQPTIVDHINAMSPCGESVKRFHLQHIKAVREAAGRKMKLEKPEYKFETIVNAIDGGGYIEVIVSFKNKSSKIERMRNEARI